MILQEFNSGLGNQMFQYAFHDWLKERYPSQKILADLSWFRWHEAHQGFELQRIFGAGLREAKTAEVIRISGRIPQTFPGAYPLDRLLRLLTEKHYRQLKLDEIDRDYPLDPEKNWYITGYYISEKYYRDRLPRLKELFRFPESEKTVMKDRIEGTLSVSVHVRHGDYMDPKYGGKFKVLPMEYYKKAVELIRSRAGNAEFFLFSDDKEYIREAFGWLEPKIVVTGNEGQDSWKDMYLMSLCRHNIAANSTFSTWGGLLNRHEDALVVYPAEYLSTEDSEVKTIPGWIRV